MKRSISLFICVLMLVAVVGTGIAQAEFDVKAKSAVLVDGKTGQVLFEKDAYKQLPPASITKIMTLLLALEAIDRGEASLTDQVSISQRASSMGGSQIYLSPKDRLSLGTLLKAVAVASANDACVAVGEYIGGTEPNFVRRMNQRAKELGMENTHFENTTGLPDPDHYSTAYDISLMARELIQYDIFREWAQIWYEQIKVSDGYRDLVNTNSLIKSYPGLDGVKTGHTDVAGYCLAASAEQDGFRLISVVLNTDSPEERNEASTNLLNYGFRAFEHKVIVKENEQVEDIPIKQGKEQTVDAYTANSLGVVILKGLSGELRREIKTINQVAPVKKGEKVGELIVYQKEKELGRVDLLAAEDIEKANIFVRFFRWLWAKILELVSNIRK